MYIQRTDIIMLEMGHIRIMSIHEPSHTRSHVDIYMEVGRVFCIRVTETNGTVAGREEAGRGNSWE